MNQQEWETAGCMFILGVFAVGFALGLTVMAVLP